MARELAYVFDWFDAQAIVAGARLGVPNLYSSTTYVALFLIAVTMWRFLSRHATPIGATTAGLLVAPIGVGGLIALGYWLRASPVDRSDGSLGVRSFVAARLPFMLFVVGASMVGLLCMVMMYKLHSVVWPESRRVYYWLPVATIIPVAAAFALAALVDRFPRAATPTRLVLAAMVITNLFALPGHQSIIRSREQQPQVAESARVRECFVGTDAIGAYSLSGPAAYACASVRARAFGRPITPETPPGTPLPALYCRRGPNVPARTGA